MASSSTLAENNKQYFDTNGNTLFKQEWVQNVMQQILESLQSHIDWIGIKKPATTEGTTSQAASIRMLDYACGNGVASRALFPYVSEVRGIDVSDGMVQEYNKSARSDGVPEAQMFAVQGDLAAPLTEAGHSILSGSDYFQFDLIVVSMALHHIDVPQVLIERLVERLNKGGVVLIIDNALDHEHSQQKEPSEGSHGLRGNAQHAAAHTISHEGFSKEQMDTMFRCAGCHEVDYLVLDEPAKIPAELGGPRRLFFARGKK